MKGYQFEIKYEGTGSIWVSAESEAEAHAAAIEKWEQIHLGKSTITHFLSCREREINDGPKLLKRRPSIPIPPAFDIEDFKL